MVITEPPTAEEADLLLHVFYNPRINPTQDHISDAEILEQPTESATTSPALPPASTAKAALSNDSAKKLPTPPKTPLKAKLATSPLPDQDESDSATVNAANTLMGIPTAELPHDQIPLAAKTSIARPENNPRTSKKRKFALCLPVYEHDITVLDNSGRPSGTLRQAPLDCWEGMEDPPTTPAHWTERLKKLGLIPNVFRQIQVAGKVDQPGKPCKCPTWGFLAYTLIAVSPDGRLKVAEIRRLSEAWCSELVPKKEKNYGSCRSSLTRTSEVVNDGDSVEPAGWWRLADNGTTKTKAKSGSNKLKTESSQNGGSGPQTGARV